MAAAPLGYADQTRLALRTIVDEHGSEILSRPRELANLLADLLPDAPRVARILVAAAQDHIADELREHALAGMDVGTASALVASTFADASMFPVDVCTWVVGEVALALELTADNIAPPVAFKASATASMVGGPGLLAAGLDPVVAAASDPAAVGEEMSTQPAPAESTSPGIGTSDPDTRIKAPFPAGAVPVSVGGLTGPASAVGPAGVIGAASAIGPAGSAGVMGSASVDGPAGMLG